MTRTFSSADDIGEKLIEAEGKDRPATTRKAYRPTANLFPMAPRSQRSSGSRKKNPLSPYFVEVPDTLRSLAFIEVGLRSRLGHIHA